MRIWVRCWFCGAERKIRRPRRARSMDVIGTGVSVRIFGPCNSPRPYGEICREPLTRRVDARRVLRAALAWERSGRNAMSEYDL